MEIISFLKNNIEPLEDGFYGAGYRAATYLKDGTYLPCVIFRNTKKTVDLAIKRLKKNKPVVVFLITQQMDTTKLSNHL